MKKEKTVILIEAVERSFEFIHPFEDGNGRVGDLLWKIIVARQTGTWPEELPPDIYGDTPSTKEEYKRAFGNIEKDS